MNLKIRFSTSVLLALVFPFSASASVDQRNGFVLVQNEAANRAIVRFDLPNGGFELSMCHGDAAEYWNTPEAACKAIPGTRFIDHASYARSGFEEAFVRAFQRIRLKPGMLYFASTGVLASVVAWGLGKIEIYRGTKLVQLDGGWVQAKNYRIHLPGGKLLVAGLAAGGLMYVIPKLRAHHQLNRRVSSESLATMDLAGPVSDEDLDQILMALAEAVQLSQLDRANDRAAGQF